MFGDRCLGLPECGHPTNWTFPCTCYAEIAKEQHLREVGRSAVDKEASRLKAQIEGMALYVQHVGSCRANDLDYLDDAPCICGLRRFYNPKGAALNPTEREGGE